MRFSKSECLLCHIKAIRTLFFHEAGGDRFSILGYVRVMVASPMDYMTFMFQQYSAPPHWSTNVNKFLSRTPSMDRNDNSKGKKTFQKITKKDTIPAVYVHPFHMKLEIQNRIESQMKELSSSCTQEACTLRQ
ncbi:hypothetical protein TNCV_365401 [Trichonephila clavipes]|nr:hypothetical protein TNCV_365401 [Trichonephila clavipes]